MQQKQYLKAEYLRIFKDKRHIKSMMQMAYLQRKLYQLYYKTMSL